MKCIARIELDNEGIITMHVRNKLTNYGEQPNYAKWYFTRLTLGLRESALLLSPNVKLPKVFILLPLRYAYGFV